MASHWTRCLAHSVFLLSGLTACPSSVGPIPIGCGFAPSEVFTEVTDASATPTLFLGQTASLTYPSRVRLRPPPP